MKTRYKILIVIAVLVFVILMIVDIMTSPRSCYSGEYPPIPFIHEMNGCIPQKLLDLMHFFGVPEY